MFRSYQGWQCSSAAGLQLRRFQFTVKTAKVSVGHLVTFSLNLATFLNHFGCFVSWSVNRSVLNEEQGLP